MTNLQNFSSPPSIPGKGVLPQAVMTIALAASLIRFHFTMGISWPSLLRYDSHVWLLYVSCAWVAGVFWGSKIGLHWPALSAGLTHFAYSGHSKTGTVGHSSGAQKRRV